MKVYFQNTLEIAIQDDNICHDSIINLFNKYVYH